MSDDLRIRLSLDGSQYAAGLSRASTDSRRFADDALRDFRRVESGAGVMSTAVARGAQAAVGALGVREIVQAGDEWASLTARVKLASEGLGSATVAQDRLFQTAQDSRAPVADLATVYARMAGVGKELGKTLGDVLDATDTVSKAMALGGGSAGSQAAALQQLGQALGSGTLRGEEFNSVMEQAPRLAQALADGLGITTGQLRAMANEGKLSSQAVLEALQRSRAGIEAEFAKMPQTVGGALVQLQNSFLKTFGVLSESGGLTSTFASGIKLVADNMGVAVTAAAALSLGLLAQRQGFFGLSAAANEARIVQLAQSIATGGQTAASGTAVVAARALIAANVEQAASALAVVRADQAQVAVTIATHTAKLLQIADARAAAVASLAEANATIASTAAMGAQSVALAANRIALAARSGALTELAALGQAAAASERALAAAQAQGAVAAAASTRAAAALATAQGTAAAAATAGGLAARAGAAALGLLGGPIGAVITVLGLGAVAWSAWKTSAVEANEEARTATVENDAEIVARLSGQIELLQKRKELLAISNVTTADKVGAEQAGSAYGRIEGRRQRVMAGTATPEEGGTLTGAAKAQLVAQLTEQAGQAYTAYVGQTQIAVDRAAVLGDKLLENARKTATLDLDVKRQWAAEAADIAQTYQKAIDLAAGDPGRVASLTAERDARLIAGQRQTNEKLLGMQQQAGAAGRALGDAQADLRWAQAAAATAAVERSAAAELATLEGQRAADTIGLAAYLQRKGELEQRALTAKAALIQREIELDSQRSGDGTAASAVARQAKLVALREKLSGATADGSAAAGRSARELIDADVASAEAAYRRLSAVQERAADLIAGLAASNRSAAIELNADPAMAELQRTQEAVRQLQLAADSIVARLKLEQNLTLDQAQVDALQAQIDKISDQTMTGIALANADLAERVKPGWQRMLEVWQDNNRLMRESWDDAMGHMIQGGEDGWVQFMTRGKLSVGDLVKTAMADLARLQFRQSIAPSFASGAQTALQVLGFQKPAAVEQQGRAPSTGVDTGALATTLGQVTKQTLGESGEALTSAADAFQNPIASLLGAGNSLVQSALGWLLPQTAQLSSAATMSAAAAALMGAAGALSGAAASLAAGGGGGGSSGGWIDTAMTVASMFAADGAVVDGGGWHPATTFARGAAFGNNSQGAPAVAAVTAVPFAVGGAFGAGEVLTQPTLFRFKDKRAVRMGVAGEAGAEAALPLRQGGVTASVNGQAAGSIPLTRNGGLLGIDLTEFVGQMQDRNAQPFAAGGAFGDVPAAAPNFGNKSAGTGAGQGAAAAAGQGDREPRVQITQSLVFQGNGVSRSEMGLFAKQVKEATEASVFDAMRRGRRN